MKIRRALSAIAVVAATGLGGAIGASAPAHAAATFPNVVVPAPASEVADGTTFTLASAATITSDDANVGGYLATILRTSTGYALPLTVGATSPPAEAVERLDKKAGDPVRLVLRP